MNVPQYTREGDGYRCHRHKVWFADTASCSDCDKDPGPPPTAEREAMPAPPKGCMSTEQLERVLFTEAEVIRKAANKYASGKVRTRIGASSAAKLWDTWVKVVRAAGELAQRREDDEIVRRQEAREDERESRKHH